MCIFYFSATWTTFVLYLYWRYPRVHTCIQVRKDYDNVPSRCELTYYYDWRGSQKILKL
jgi:hypothetical protein